MTKTLALALLLASAVVLGTAPGAAHASSAGVTFQGYVPAVTDPASNAREARRAERRRDAVRAWFRSRPEPYQRFLRRHCGRILKHPAAFVASEVDGCRAIR